MNAPRRDKSEQEDVQAPRAGSGEEETLRVSGIATARYTAKDRIPGASPVSLLFWRPVLAFVDGLSWLFGHAGGLTTIGVLVVVGLLGRAILPPYFAHYALKDEVAEIGRTPTRDDAEVRERLREAIRRRKLEAYIPEDAFDVTLTGNQRRIVGSYKVPLELLGRRHELVFSIDLDQWVAIQEAPRFAR